MGHLLVLSYFAAFGAGIVAATVSFQLYREEGKRYLRDYFHYLVLMNVIVGGHLTAVYLMTNASTSIGQGSPRSVLAGIEILGFTLVAALVYKLIAVMRGLLERQLSARFRFAFVVGVCLLVIAFLIVLWRDSGGVSKDIPFLALIVYLSLTATAIVAMLLTLKASCSVADERRRRTTRFFSGVHLAIYLILPMTGIFPSPFSRHILSICFIALCLIPLAHLRRFLLYQRASGLLQPEHAESMDAFLSRFEISHREREIIDRLLAGKTNAQIGELLHISPHTVKNHIYNVYRKARVRNRIQLANLIRSQNT